MRLTQLLGICFVSLLVACAGAVRENPAEMFAGLLEKYQTAEYESRRLDGGPSEGMGIGIFDANNKISEDILCKLNLYASLGQTQYVVYRKDGEDIWYFHKQVYFYDEPYELENAEILNTYFKYTNDLPYAFNEATGKYDIQADTKNYLAIVDVGSLSQLIEIIQDALD